MKAKLLALWLLCSLGIWLFAASASDPYSRTYDSSPLILAALNFALALSMFALSDQEAGE